MNNMPLDQYKTKGFAIPEGLSLIRVTISGCTFLRKLDYTDIGLPKDMEKELGSLGSKHVLNREFPSEWQRNTTQAYKYMDSVGISFGEKVWAVRTSDYDEIVKEVHERFYTKAMSLKANLLENYEEQVESFADEAESLRSGFRELVLSQAFKKSYLERQLSFEIESQKEMIDAIPRSSVVGLGRMAKEYHDALLKRANDNKTPVCITRQSRNKLVEMLQYCVKFSFVTNALVNAKHMIEDVINILPSKVVANGRYKQETSLMLQLLVNLQNADKLSGIKIVSKEDVSSADETDDDLIISPANPVIDDECEVIEVQSVASTQDATASKPKPATFMNW